VPIISHYDLDQTLSETIGHVIAQALKTVEGTKAAVDTGADEDDGLLNRAVGVIDREREGSGSHEAVS
jgi:hypothetical protein